MSKEKQKQSAKPLIFAMLLSGLVLIAIFGSVFPIAKAEPGVCNPQIKRLSLIKGELGQFLDIKQKEIDRDKLQKATGISMGCSMGNNAELYVFKRPR